MITWLFKWLFVAFVPVLVLASLGSLAAGDYGWAAFFAVMSVINYFNLRGASRQVEWKGRWYC